LCDLIKAALPEGEGLVGDIIVGDPNGNLMTKNEQICDWMNYPIVMRIFNENPDFSKTDCHIYAINFCTAF